MNLFRLSLANLAISPLSTAVNILLLSLGTASIAILLIATYQLTTTLTRDSADIDLVIGAKGSPLQLVLAGVYHADVPPGNISLKEVDPWMAHPYVKTATPLALGDNYQGFRIVGSQADYLEIYGGEIAQGRLWERPLEIVAGSQVAREAGLTIDSTFSGVHGLETDGHEHEQQRYLVVGILAPTGTVLDRLLVTSAESVRALHHSEHDDHDHEADADDADDPLHYEEHEEHNHEEHSHEEHSHDDHGKEDHNDASHAHDENDQQVTVVLVKYASPLAALSLPREINAGSSLQAASPAFEITRLLQIVGIGIGWLQAFAAILLLSAALSIFAALYASLKARRKDLAVLRCLGATRWELFVLLFVEGMALTVAGIAVGLAAAHGGLEIIGTWLSDNQNINLTGMIWAPAEYALVAGLLTAGLLTAIIPAWQAFSTDVAQTLAKP